MPTLHTVSQSPFTHSALETCARYMLPGAGLLLLENGVFAARNGSVWAAHLTDLEGLHIYALAPDLRARGIAIETISPNIEIVDYAGFVELAVKYDRVQSWL